MSRKCLNMVIGMLVIFCFAGGSFAGETATYSKDDIIRALKKPAQEYPEGYKPRAIRPKKETPRPSIAMEINFKKNSFQLTDEATKILDVVGEALNDETLSSSEIIIEGHTDASGSAEYNMSLSQKRAKAVKDYLTKKAKVDPGRLQTLGKGENEPRFKNPYAAGNRRVKFINSK